MGIFIGLSIAVFAWAGLMWWIDDKDKSENI